MIIHKDFAHSQGRIVHGAISPDLATFMYNYFILKRRAVQWLIKNHPEFKDKGVESSLHGTWKDPQALNTYSVYGDHVGDTLLMRLLPTMQNFTELILCPCYSFARLYKKGDVLEKHTDRPSCEISATLHLGGDYWDIYLGGEAIKLKVGDMLIYKGSEIEHWREKFEGEICAQVFLHYNNSDGPLGKQNLYDKRPTLGLPSDAGK
jgi:hypothetical protein